jgi:hypothetical protein
MKKYMLLRNGEVYGPYTVDELMHLQWLPDDRVSMEDEPENWMDPSSVTELHPVSAVLLPGTGAERPAKNTGTRKKSSFSSFFLLGDIDDAFRNLRVATVFILMIIGTLSIKILVDSFIEQTYYAGQVQTASVMPPSHPVASKNFRNALVKNYVRPQDSNSKRYLKPQKPKEIRKLVKVEGKTFPAGDQKPGSLIITVVNNSEYLVDNAEIQVSYEKEGEIVASQTYHFRQLSPLGSKTLSVPHARKGTSVSYKVLHIYTRQYTALLKDV